MIQSFKLLKNVKPIYLKQGEKSEHNIDPHAWLSLGNGIEYVKPSNQHLKMQIKHTQKIMTNKALNIYQNLKN